MDATPKYVEALLELDAAHDAVVAIVRALPPGLDAFRKATALRDHVETMAERDARLRAEIARRIRDDESLTLAALGDRLSLSSARAQQLVNKGASTTEEAR